MDNSNADELNNDVTMYEDDDYDDNVEPKIIIKDTTSTKRVQDIGEEEIYMLYQTLDIGFDEIMKKFGTYRLNVIHIRGVQEMSSDDVLAYFNDYDPNSIEWVNDLSCNVVFDTDKSAATAMLGLTQALVMKVTHTFDINYGIDLVDSDSLRVPVPPGRWRLGRQHDKSKALLLRFATHSDKKIKGARKLSSYYAKYGVPKNTTDDKSVIEKPWTKRRYSYYDDNNNNDDGSNIDYDDELVIKSKRLRMRMRADEEEELIEKGKRVTDRIKSWSNQQDQDQQDQQDQQENKKRSVWDRLDNDEQGNYCGVDPLLEMTIASQLPQQGQEVNRNVGDNNDDVVEERKRPNVWSRISLQPVLRSQISKSYIKTNNSNNNNNNNNNNRNKDIKSRLGTRRRRGTGRIMYY